MLSINDHKMLIFDLRDTPARDRSDQPSPNDRPPTSPVVAFVLQQEEPIA